MTGRARLRVLGAGRVVSSLPRWLSLSLWLGAASVAGLFLDVPLVPDPSPGSGVDPSAAPAVNGPAQGSPKGAPRPKTEEKTIEFAPWERVPA